MAIKEQSYYAVGKVYIRERGSESGWSDFGEVDTLDIANDVDKKTLPTNRTLGGGNANSFSRVNSVEMAINFREFSPLTLDLGLLGESTAVVSGEITDEEHIAYTNTLVKVEYPGITDVVVTDTAGGTGVTYEVEVDYTVESGGIFIIPGGAITDATPVFVTYTHPGVDVIQAMAASAKEYEVYVDGLNEAQSGAPFTGEFFRCKPTMAETLGLLTAQYGELSVPFEVLQDTTKTGALLSKFYKLIKKTAE